MPKPDMKARIKRFLFLALVLLLAGTPAYLVFRDRWLGLEKLPTPFYDAWCKWQFLCGTGLPEYFAAVLLCLLALLVVVFLWKDDPALYLPNIFPVAAISQPSEPDVGQLRLSRILLLVSVVLVVLTFLLSPLSYWVPGWGYLLSLSLFGLGWFLREVPVSIALQRIWEKRQVIVAFLLAHLALILFLSSLASFAGANWVYALLLFLAAFNLARYYREIPLILWVFNLALVLYVININHWAYSVVGDDYGFFMYALRLVNEDDLTLILSRLFSSEGVYGAHPVFSSMLQALSMRWLGADSFGWRFSSLYLSALAVVFFYYFYKCFTSQLLAMIGALFLAASSYIMTFGKIGYNNLQALFALSLTLAAATWALRSRRDLALVALGFSLGLCLYVYPAALYILPLPFLLYLFYDPPRNRDAARRWLLVFIALSLWLIPLLVQPKYWISKQAGLFTYGGEVGAGLSGLALHFARNILDAFFSFLYIPDESHFVAVAYTDPLSGVLILLGLVYLLKRWSQDRFNLFVLLSFAYLLVVVGASHDRYFPPTTRMFLLLPWWTLFAALGLGWLVAQIVRLQARSFTWANVTTALLVVMIGLNLYQANPLSIRRSGGNQTLEVLFAGFAEKLSRFEPDNPMPVDVLFVTDQNWGIEGLYWMQRAYGFPASRLRLQRVIADGPRFPETVAGLIDQRDIVVILQPNLEPAWREGLEAHLSEHGKVACDYNEWTRGDTRFVLWHAPDLSALCQEK